MGENVRNIKMLCHFCRKTASKNNKTVNEKSYRHIPMDNLKLWHNLKKTCSCLLDTRYYLYLIDCIFVDAETGGLVVYKVLFTDEYITLILEYIVTETILPPPRPPPATRKLDNLAKPPSGIVKSVDVLKILTITVKQSNNSIVLKTNS